MDACYGSIYGVFAEGGFYGDAIAGMGQNWYQVRRSVSFLDQTANSRSDGQTYFGQLDGGYDWHVRNLIIGPTANLQYVSLEQNGVTEEDAGAADLNIERRGYNSLQSGLGGRAAMAFDVGQTKLVPSVRAQWIHQYMTASRAINASFVDGGPAFTVRGNEPTGNSLQTGLGLDIQLSADLVLYVDYDLTAPFGSYEMVTNSVYGGLKYKF